ncbi:MAG: flagellar basal body-associated protein FliL [Sphingomonas bacterium]|jgi:flagellar FliL protein|nr:flagellar basal body-associated FliL family protein [Sphingomonas bacterium]MDB5688234.1 flagellar basal body-associated protein FliL [Sphingomonas bacterium]
MSDDTEGKPAKKKGGKIKMILLAVAGVAVLGGGGVAAGMYVGGGHGPAKEVEDPNRPKLVPREGAEAHGDVPAGKAKGIDPRRYQASFYPIEQSFTSNLRDTDGFVQIGLGVSTFYDQKVLDNLKTNEMPIRSAVLMTLADQDAETITTQAGKKALQNALKGAINQVLVNREGFGGVNDVYFTSFIIQ